MRKLIVSIVLVGLIASPASAAECATGTIRYADIGSPILVPDVTIGEVDTIDVVGRFLWVSDNGELASTRIPDDAVAFQACPDGTVTFTTGDVPEPTREPVVDVSAEQWTEYVSVHSAGVHPI